MAGFQVFINGRFWVSTEDRTGNTSNDPIDFELRGNVHLTAVATK
jgi:hypothetical protein